MANDQLIMDMRFGACKCKAKRKNSKVNKCKQPHLGFRRFLQVLRELGHKARSLVLVVFEHVDLRFRFLAPCGDEVVEILYKPQITQLRINKRSKKTMTTFTKGVTTPVFSSFAIAVASLSTTSLEGQQSEGKNSKVIS